jgi:hypothetical protein
MTPTKAIELDPNPQRMDDSRCVLCHPPDPKKTIREDELWGRCSTNAKHSHEGPIQHT